eukprot:TRINITY_DN22221_c0_g1_i1.p1 TRINITY_DN22221_c0_g1~~TRINITY_DN22221_c0_g1_i1.p1  ORF type:complete len:303 (+),score=26.73 TRINITY_DN22221_c0_g1_i1:46-954(+)
MAAFAAEDVLRSWTQMRSLSAADLMPALEKLLEQVESRSFSSEVFIKAELVRQGLAEHLLNIVEDSAVRQHQSCRRTADAPEVVKALEVLQRLLQRNEEACEVVGDHTCFETILKVASADFGKVEYNCILDFPTLTLLVAALSCMNLVIAVSPKAREMTVEEKVLIPRLARFAVGEGFKGYAAIFSDIALEAMSHLVVPDCSKESKAFSLKSEQCCICMEPMEQLEAFWQCHVCCQALHRDCAQEWLSKRRRCPYCRAMGLPEVEVTELFSVRDLLRVLHLERVSRTVVAWSLVLPRSWALL